MKKLTAMLLAARRSPMRTIWRQIGKPAAAIVSGIVFAVVIVHGESWAIRQAPLLPTPSATASAASCVPEDTSDTGVLPVAILH